MPSGTMAGYVNSGEFTPIYNVADHYIGILRVLVPLTGITAVFAAFTAISITASRLLYALSREGLAPRMFAKVDEHKVAQIEEEKNNGKDPLGGVQPVPQFGD